MWARAWSMTEFPGGAVVGAIVGDVVGEGESVGVGDVVGDGESVAVGDTVGDGGGTVGVADRVGRGRRVGQDPLPATRTASPICPEWWTPGWR
jgi:hypothetical protein